MKFIFLPLALLFSAHAVAEYFDPKDDDWVYIKSTNVAVSFNSINPINTNSDMFDIELLRIHHRHTEQSHLPTYYIQDIRLNCNNNSYSEKLLAKYFMGGKQIPIGENDDIEYNGEFDNYSDMAEVRSYTCSQVPKIREIRTQP